jgi:hypothetical protein
MDKKQITSAVNCLCSYWTKVLAPAEGGEQAAKGHKKALDGVLSRNLFAPPSFFKCLVFSAQTLLKSCLGLVSKLELIWSLRETAYDFLTGLLGDFLGEFAYMAASAGVCTQLIFRFDKVIGFAQRLEKKRSPRAVKLLCSGASIWIVGGTLGRLREKHQTEKMEKMRNEVNAKIGGMEQEEIDAIVADEEVEKVAGVAEEEQGGEAAPEVKDIEMEAES